MSRRKKKGNVLDDKPAKIAIKRMNNVLNLLEKAHSTLYTAAANAGNIKLESGVSHDGKKWRKEINKVLDKLEDLTADYEVEISEQSEEAGFLS